MVYYGEGDTVTAVMILLESTMRTVEDLARKVEAVLSTHTLASPITLEGAPYR